MKSNLKKLGLIAVVCALFVSFTACSSGNKSSQSSDNSKSTSQSSKKSTESNISVNKDKTDQLKKEKIISNGKVYIQNNRVIATMVIKDGTSDADAKALADKYAKQLKKEHKNMPVSVMAVKNNKNVANVTIK